MRQDRDAVFVRTRVQLHLAESSRGRRRLRGPSGRRVLLRNFGRGFLLAPIELWAQLRVAKAARGLLVGRRTSAGRRATALVVAFVCVGNNTASTAIIGFPKPVYSTDVHTMQKVIATTEGSCRNAQAAPHTCKQGDTLQRNQKNIVPSTNTTDGS